MSDVHPVDEPADPYAAPRSERSRKSTDAQAESPPRPAFTRAHVWVLAILFGLATIQTFVVTVSGVDPGSDKWRHVITATLLTISGPMTGAICRDLQSCCLDFSASLLPWFLPPLIGAFALQQIWRPRSVAGESVRVTIWGLAWLAWFFGGHISFLHALM